jgi:hypothetical protein
MLDRIRGMESWRLYESVTNVRAALHRHASSTVVRQFSHLLLGLYQPL